MTIYPNCESSYRISFAYSTHFLCCSCIYSSPHFLELLKIFNIPTKKEKTLQAPITVNHYDDYSSTRLPLVILILYCAFYSAMRGFFYTFIQNKDFPYGAL